MASRQSSKPQDPAKVSERQRKNAKARWDQTPKNERSAEMSRIAQARWAKYRQQQQKKKAKQTSSHSSTEQEAAA